MGENKQNKRQRPFLRVSAVQTPLFFAFHCQLRKELVKIASCATSSFIFVISFPLYYTMILNFPRLRMDTFYIMEDPRINASQLANPAISSS